MSHSQNTKQKIRICLLGATGKMGREVIRSLPFWKNIKLVSAVGLSSAGKNLNSLIGGDCPPLVIGADLNQELQNKKVDVLLDLTAPGSTLKYTLCALEHRVAPLIGTSGLQSEEFNKIDQASRAARLPTLVVPNFSIGAVLGMQFAQLAAKWMPNVEIIETHHDQKLDAPSGTAIETARLIELGRTRPSTVPETKHIKVPGVRGGKVSDVPIHSIRLNGILAQQSVVFGGPGETLEIKHTTIDRSTYMPGIEMALHAILGLPLQLTIGLENILK